MRYWIVASRRKKALWTPQDSEDFYDTIYYTKEDAEDCISTTDKRYYKAYEVEMNFVKEGK